MKNYKCQNCGGISTGEEIDKVTAKHFEVDLDDIGSINRGEEDRECLDFLCPKCNTCLDGSNFIETDEKVIIVENKVIRELFIVECINPKSNEKYCTEDGYLSENVWESIKFEKETEAEGWITTLDEPEKFKIRPLRITWELI